MKERSTKFLRCVATTRDRGVIRGSVFVTVAGGVLLGLPAAAEAYVGPGAGISLLGALWALIAVVGSAILYVILWPWRRLRKRRKQEKKAREAQGGHAMESEDSQDGQREHKSNEHHDPISK